jgi:hypothetical protein
MTDAPHLDDEQLSALIDGDAGADEAIHAEGCERCSGRLAQLRSAVAAVAAPPPPPSPAERDRAITAAIGAREVGGSSPAIRHKVVPLRPRRAGPPAWLLVAAVVLVAVLAVPFLLRGDGDDDQFDAATSAQDSAESSGGGDAASTLEAAVPLVDAGDLGPIDASTDLRPLLALAADQDRATDGAPTTTAGGEAAGQSAPADALHCEAGLRADDPDLGALRVVATATFDGVPAQVLVFDRPADAQLVAYVVAIEDCRVLNFSSFTF